MSKELEALEGIKNCLFWSEEGLKDLDLIETALEDYESLKILNENQKHNIEMLMEENKLLRESNENKKLKALEIIKNKFVNITILMGCESLEEYNKHPLTMRKGILTQEEFELLKEVLL